MHFSNLLCKSCKPIKSKNYCANCMRKIANHKLAIREARLKRAREKNEAEWLSKEARDKRLIIKLKRLSLKQLASIEKGNMK